MSRGYPRFLFSNPQNTKEPGPFVVHLLFPKCICKVYDFDKVRKTFSIKEISFFDECGAEKKEDVLNQMRNWLFYQILEDQITI
jgi:hypothetical protein